MKILLLGKDGQVGWELCRALAPLGELLPLGRGEMDIENIGGLRNFVRRYQPDFVVNAAAYTAVDQAESEPGKAFMVNAEAVGMLAEEARRSGCWLVHYSTDYVFDGTKAGFYLEDDTVNPLSIYGRSKLAGEEMIRVLSPYHLIFRTSWVYATRGTNFAKTMLRLACERNRLSVVADQVGSPTSAELIADITSLAVYHLQNRLNPSVLSGTYHLVASGEVSWYEYAVYLLGLAQERGMLLKVKIAEIEPLTSAQYPTPAPRPRNSRLDTSKLREAFSLHLPDWRYHVKRFIAQQR